MKCPKCNWPMIRDYTNPLKSFHFCPQCVTQRSYDLEYKVKIPISQDDDISGDVNNG